MLDLYASNRTHEEIALEGARLIDGFFNGLAEYSFLCSPWDVPYGTALVYGDLCGPAEKIELFKTLLRNYFLLASIHELSYVEYLGGGADPIWVMLVEVCPGANLTVGVDLCRCASFGWSLKKYLKLTHHHKRRLDPTLKLLVPSYPDVDLGRPLSELLLSEQPVL